MVVVVQKYAILQCYRFWTCLKITCPGIYLIASTISLYWLIIKDDESRGARNTYKYNSQLPNLNMIKDYSFLSSVEWKSQDSGSMLNLKFLKLIDFSSNRLTGGIPESFSSMRALVSLDLSRNSLTGNISPDIGKMESLESLDLSENQLSGQIPTSLAELSFLGVLNLSNNNLSGKFQQVLNFRALIHQDMQGIMDSVAPLLDCAPKTPQLMERKMMVHGGSLLCKNSAYQ